MVENGRHLREMFLHILTNYAPGATANIEGNTGYSYLHGNAYFYSVPMGGVLVEVEVFGLPDAANNSSAFYGMHLHEHGDCTKLFDKTGSHYNPTEQLHPNHAGDFPPLLGNRGFAYACFYTERFRIEDIIGRSIIIHRNADDFTTQPSGNSGEKIGCGVIVRGRG